MDMRDFPILHLRHKFKYMKNAFIGVI